MSENVQQPQASRGRPKSRIGTVVYFLFFLLMPWYSVIDETLPVPARVA